MKRDELRCINKTELFVVQKEKLSIIVQTRVTVNCESKKCSRYFSGEVEKKISYKTEYKAIFFSELAAENSMDRLTSEALTPFPSNT